LHADVEALGEIRSGSGAANGDEPVRVREGERSEEDRVDDVEHPRDRADRESERAHGGDEESWGAKQGPPPMVEVTPEALDPGERLRDAEPLLHEADVAEV